MTTKKKAAAKPEKVDAEATVEEPLTVEVEPATKPEVIPANSVRAEVLKRLALGHFSLDEATCKKIVVDEKRQRVEITRADGRALYYQR